MFRFDLTTLTALLATPATAFWLYYEHLQIATAQDIGLIDVLMAIGYLDPATL